MSVNIDIRIINLGRTGKRARISSDDWDSAYMDLLEAEAICTAGEWMERRILPGSDPLPDKYRGKV